MSALSTIIFDVGRSGVEPRPSLAPTAWMHPNWSFIDSPRQRRETVCRYHTLSHLIPTSIRVRITTRDLLCRPSVILRLHPVDPSALRVKASRVRRLYVWVTVTIRCARSLVGSGANLLWRTFP